MQNSFRETGIKVKDEKGITIIALTVMVIIILILTGITVGALNGEGSVLNRSLTTSKKAENMSEVEAIKKAVITSNMIGRGKIDEEILVQEIEDALGEQENAWKIKGNSSDGWTVKIIKDDRIIRIDTDGEVADLTELIKNYGTVVEGYNADNREWQVFYAGVKETFLITKPIITFGQIPTTSISGYNYIGITDIQKSFYGRNWNKKCLFGGTENTKVYDNKKATAYMCDSGNWTQYCEEPANYAVGGATLELFVASWNDTHEEEKQVNQISCGGVGYVVPSLLGRTNILDANDCNGIYKATIYYWLASPSRDRSDCMISVAGGNLKYLSGGYALTNGRSIRPIVSIPTNKIKVDGERVIIE